MRRASLAAAALGTILLSACGHSPEPTFLTLDYAPPVSPIRSPATPFRVGELRVPPSMDRPELARETEAGKVRIDDFARWSAPVDQILRRVLTEDLVARLPRGSVVYPDTPADAGAETVAVDMLSLVERDGQLHLVVGWAFARPASSSGRPRTTASDRHSLTLVAPLENESPAATARAMSVLCGKLADDIAAAAASRD